MARKKAATPSAPTADAPVDTDTDSSPAQNGVVEAFEPVKVNNASIAELKIACDDAVRRYFSRPEQFRTRNTHTDVRLALGWTSVLVAGATGYYGWQRDFEEAKPLVFIGVLLYFLLTGIQTAYAYFIEGKIIYVGRRRTLAHRIENERITIQSETKPSPIPSSSASPRYALTFSYTRSTGKGQHKTIIAKGNAIVERPYIEFFDTEGKLDEQALVDWLARESAGVVSDSDSDKSALKLAKDS